MGVNNASYLSRTQVASSPQLTAMEIEMANHTLTQDASVIQDLIAKIEATLINLKYELDQLSKAMLKTKQYHGKAAEIACLIIDLARVQQQLNYIEQIVDDEAKQSGEPLIIKPESKD